MVFVRQRMTKNESGGRCPMLVPVAIRAYPSSHTENPCTQPNPAWSPLENHGLDPLYCTLQSFSGYSGNFGNWHEVMPLPCHR